MISSTSSILLYKSICSYNPIRIIEWFHLTCTCSHFTLFWWYDYGNYVSWSFCARAKIQWKLGFCDNVIFLCRWSSLQLIKMHLITLHNIVETMNRHHENWSSNVCKTKNLGHCQNFWPWLYIFLTPPRLHMNSTAQVRQNWPILTISNFLHVGSSTFSSDGQVINDHKYSVVLE